MLRIISAGIRYLLFPHFRCNGYAARTPA